MVCLLRTLLHLSRSIREGDFKSQELFLRSKGGWSPTSTVNEVEQSENPDEDTSAIDSLMTLLGKSNGTTPDEDNG